MNKKLKSLKLLLVSILSIGVLLPATSVHAQEAQYGNTKIVTPDGPNYQSSLKGTYTDLLTGDFNGDGRLDLIRQEKNGWDQDTVDTVQFYLSNGDENFQIVTNEGFEYMNILGGTYNNIIPGDFNGDGKTDFARQEKNGWDQDNEWTFQIYTSRGDGTFEVNTPVGDMYQVALKGTYTNLIPGDFNGDGKTDFIRQEKGPWADDNITNFQVYLSLGNGNFEIINQYGFNFQDINRGESVNLVPGDFNGDGYCDFIRQEKNGLDNDTIRTVDVYFSNGNGYFTVYTPSGNQYQESLKGTYTNLIPGDFDGDGKTDFAKQEKNGWDDDNLSTFQLYFSKGDGTFSVQTPDLGWYGDVLKGTYTNLYAADINGDKKAEVLRQEKSGWDHDDAFTFNIYYLNIENEDALAQLYEVGTSNKVRYSSPSENLALLKGASASYELTASGQTASKAVDGTWNDVNSKWCTGYGKGTDQWLMIDLGQYRYIDRWVVTHSKWYDQRMYTRKYRLQYIDASGSWVNADSVVNNTANQTDRILTRQFLARYVRIYVDKGDFDDCIRIHEFELYNSIGYVPAPGDILLTEESTPDHSGLIYSGDATIEAQTEGVNTRKLSKWYNYGSFKVMRVKNASYPLAKAVASYAHSKLGYPYNYDFSDYKNTSSFYCNSLVYRSYRSNGVSSVNLDSDVWLPPLTVSDIMDDDDTYTVFDY
jgi:uncharacterized protein YycO